MIELKNWKEISKGFYRYVLGANVCYEIHIIKHHFDKSLLQSKANLYLSGDWHDTTRGINYFERELLCEEKTVQELLEFAKDDFDKNMK